MASGLTIDLKKSYIASIDGGDLVGHQPRLKVWKVIPETNIAVGEWCDYIDTTNGSVGKCRKHFIQGKSVWQDPPKGWESSPDALPDNEEETDKILDRIYEHNQRFVFLDFLGTYSAE